MSSRKLVMIRRHWRQHWKSLLKHFLEIGGGFVIQKASIVGNAHDAFVNESDVAARRRDRSAQSLIPLLSSSFFPVIEYPSVCRA